MQVKNKLQFAESIAAITAADEREAATARKAAVSEIRYLKPAARREVGEGCIHVTCGDNAR
jgi:hypothetical protein